MERMTKEELITLIKELGIDKEEFLILSSSALVFRNLFSNAGDLDILVSKKGFIQLNNKYTLKQKSNGWYIVNDKCECLVEEKSNWQIEKWEDYNLESLEKYFEYLKNSTREKDKIKYNIVKAELEKRKQ